MTMPQLAGIGGGGGGSHYAAQPLDRLVRKEVALGSIRERPVPLDHLGLQMIAPFKDVESDDVIFEYIGNNIQETMAPARAEDAESELSQKDMLAGGEGRASIIDWALKDRYVASDVTRYRDSLILQQATQGIQGLSPMSFTGRTVQDFQNKVARDDARRRRALDNRAEWLIMQAVENGLIAYNDGKIKFTVDFQRPANQQNQAPTSGLWNTTTFDPIGDINTMNQWMYDNHGVRLRRAITSKRVLDRMWKSALFVQMVGGVGAAQAAAAGANINLDYLVNGWNPQAAVDAVSRVTGVNFTTYDTVYRTRALGSSNFVNTRYLSDNKIFFLPEEAELGEVNDTEIGFAKMLTSPHPEGNWSSGFYEWELEERDPWQTVRGTGVKMFPVFPYMEYTYTMTVL
jgi:major capsid protein E